jgi:nitrous oxide reductase
MKATRLNRRQFLTTVGIGGAAAAAAVATRQASEGAQQKPASSRQGKGYQVTEHVRRYYETTKV